MEDKKPRNEAAGQKQAEVRKEEVAQDTVQKQAKTSELTNKNADYMFHFQKALAKTDLPSERQAEIVAEMTAELKEKQKNGVVANKLYGPVTEKVKELVEAPAKAEANKPQPFWMTALDNGLIMLILFCVMYALLGFFDQKSINTQANGWLTLLVTSVVAGTGLAYFYTALSPEKMAASKHKWLKMFGATGALIIVWLVAYYLVMLVPTEFNRTLSPIAYTILAIIGFGVRYYLKQKLGFKRVTF